MQNEVVSLGYVVITAEDPVGWGAFAESVFGMQIGSQPTPDPERDTVYLRADERSWRLAVERGADGGVAALGFEVMDGQRLEELKNRLTAAGVAVKDAPEVATQRRVVELFQVDDPAGFPLEFFYGAKTEKLPFVSPRGVKFVTGAQGVGHAVLLGGDSGEMYGFYVDLLGFRVSDVIPFGPVTGYFTSPSPRHHSIAFGVPGPAALQHIMLQVEDIDMVGLALDRVYDAGVRLQSGLGRHTNDHMFSFYCFTPSGLVVEYGWGGREIDNASHTTGYYDAPSIWGHRPPDDSDPFEKIVEEREL